MDISSYIGELLFEHDCVIVPGFGGFICSYRAAAIHPVMHTIAPPSKAISFNRHLQSNDGLLVNHIANASGVSFDAATALVNGWSSSSNNLLKKGEEITLRKIGSFCNDAEGNLQFTPAGEVNYLKTSFGLPTITAEPIAREQEIAFSANETKQVAMPRRRWRIAAAAALLLSLGVLGGLVWKGVEINSLQLNEAGVFNFITKIFTLSQPEVKPITVEEKKAETTATTSEAAETITESVAPVAGIKEESAAAPAIEQPSGPVYYIVIGAFAEEGNVEQAKQRLQQKYPDSLILTEKGKRITRLGYSVGNNFAKAKEQLAAAQAEDSSYWLLKK